VINLPTQSKAMVMAVSVLLIVVLAIHIAQSGYQFGRFLAGH
jgi:hypothetical protein